ncbi:hypothetical protein FRC03_008860 [Tulasnella sp. 419]|nr:hypothetical protein FRC03_008860 [Tulasnella sp. 419]
MARTWQEIAKLRKQAQHNSIPQEWTLKNEYSSLGPRNVIAIPENSGLLTPLELEITNTADISIILDNLKHSIWSSRNVTSAFYKRAIIAQQLTNCLTEIFIEKALARADYVDDYLKKSGKPMGPLHGLPISLKDQFAMKGIETIMGYVSWVGEYANHDAVIVEILHEMGAVPFVRTNVPQSLMFGETYNNVFGRTTNPFNRSLTAGGSSGGEGALIALRGSPIGIGTDIGGSVRIPASFCGIYSLRPSYNRLPYGGALNSMEGQEAFLSVIGPMTSSVSSLKIFTKAVLDSKPWTKDPLVLRKGWSESEYQLQDHGGGDKLVFGFMWDNGIIRPHPPVRRAMEMVKKALKQAGHKVVDWHNYKHMEIYKVTETIFYADAGEDIRVVCRSTGEPVIKTMSPKENLEQMSQEDGAYSLVYALEKDFIEDPDAMDPPTATLVEQFREGITGLSAYELWSLHQKRRGLRYEYNRHWEETKSSTGTARPVDAIICPVEPYAATPHGLNSDAFYTTIWNVLDCPAAAFPVTTVKPEDHPDAPHEFYNDEDKFVYEMYKPERFKDAPVGLQLVGRCQEEEAVIRMTEIVDSALKVMGGINI